MGATLLIVEDDQDISDILYREFSCNGFEVCRAWSGTEGRLALANSPDLIILDLTLPGMSGEELITYIDEDIPVIALSSKSSTVDKVKMLKLGCVDYVTKPFDIEELKTRVDVHLKNSLKNKSSKPADNVHFSYGGVILNLETREVSVGENMVQLTRTEFAIFKLLITNKGRVVSKAQIINLTSEDTPDLVDSSLKVHVRNLRKKLKTITDHEFVEAIWGIGFRFVPIES